MKDALDGCSWRAPKPALVALALIAGFIVYAEESVRTAAGLGSSKLVFAASDGGLQYRPYDEQGDVSGIVKSVRLFSHRIVEEFMVLANEVVARHLEDNEIPSIYRVHEEPDPSKVENFAEIVSAFGLKFDPKKARPADFQKFISSIEGRPEERMLSYLMLRSFKQARYSEENVGHFGLASDS